MASRHRHCLLDFRGVSSALPNNPDSCIPAASFLVRASDSSSKLQSSTALLFALHLPAQQLPSPIGAIVPHRYLVAFSNGSIPGQAFNRVAGVRLLHTHNAFAIAVVQTDPSTDDAANMAALRAQPGVTLVVHDRIVSAHTLTLRPELTVTVGTPPAPPPTPVTSSTPFDIYYTVTPQNWAVVQSGGYGARHPRRPRVRSWNSTLGAGVRIAILDSGVDQYHPDLAPNLAFNLSEINQSASTGLPSPCDDGSPQDQQGHGTWTASLALAAMGPGTGLTIGVAPAATLLNIKVIERLPDPSSTAPDIATQCATGQASGLLSWVLQGIDDAIAQHADIINLSLGTLVDLGTGEGAGLQSLFNQATWAATQSGAVVIASAGNDGLDLSNPRYIELPAQSRGVLAVVASTNPACAENLTAGATGATCTPGPITLPYYSNFGAPLNAIAAPGGSHPDGPDRWRLRLGARRLQLR